jgi:saposin
MVQNDMCTECKQIVGTADMILKQNETQAEIIAALGSACTLLPSSITGVCTMLVDSYGKQAISMLAEYLADPAQLCGEIGLCVQLKSFKSKLTTPNDMCGECKVIIGTVDQVLKNDEDEIITALGSVCKLMPSSLTGVCTMLVDTYGKQAITMLVNYLADPAQLCGEIGLCVERKTSKSKLMNDMCTECKQIVGTADMILKQNETQAEIIAALGSACTLLPSSITGVCTMLVDSYGKQAISMLAEYLADPGQLCGEIGLCAQQKAFKTHNFMASKGMCTVCEEVITVVDQFLKENEQAILKDLDKVCTLIFPASTAGICTQFVDAYFGQAISLLVNYLADSQQVCKSIGLCAKQNTQNAQGHGTNWHVQRMQGNCRECRRSPQG